MPIPWQQVVSENRRIFTPVRLCGCCLEAQWPETVKRPLVGRIVRLNAAERGLEHGLQIHGGLESACFHVLAVWPRPNYLTCLCFRSLTGMSASHVTTTKPSSLLSPCSTPDTAQKCFIFIISLISQPCAVSSVINVSQIRKPRHSEDGNLPVPPSPTLQIKKSVNGGTRI